MDIVEVHTRLRVVIEFFSAGASSPVEIHACLKSVCGEDAIDVHSVNHWVRLPKNGEKDNGDRSRSH